MRTKVKLPGSLSALIFCGVLVAAASLGESSPADAFGMGGFGRMGGFPCSRTAR